MRNRRFKLLLVCLVIFLFNITPIAMGDWEQEDGWKMHWPQTPDLYGTGIDVSLFAVPLADDFNCTEGGPITDIHIWGSFRDDQLPAYGPANLTIQLSIYSNIPADQTIGWSRPGILLWSKVFIPGDYTVRQLPEEVWQDWYDPDLQDYLPDNHMLTFQYNFNVADVNEAYRQRRGITYWLVVADETADRDYEFGWKTTKFDLRWNDDAVFLSGQWYPLNYPPTHEYDGNSLDLAFVINNRWEPNMTMMCAELGDAPDSTNSWFARMTAYPSPIGGPQGVEANFPTVYRRGSPPYGPIHWLPLKAFLGASVTRESEADVGPDEDVINNIRPPLDWFDLDGADDGVGRVYLPPFKLTTFKFRVTVVDNNVVPLYVNVWFDWNRNGSWDLPSEWTVANQLIPGSGVYTTPPFIPRHPTNPPPPIWMRITLSKEQWDPQLAGGVGGAGFPGGYLYGETEDYYYILSSAEPNDYIFIPRTPTGIGLRGYYYDNINFTGYRLNRIDPQVNFNWDGSPDPSIGPDTFSVRWVGDVCAPYTETYTFYTISDDGVRLWVDDQLIIDNWTNHPPTEDSGTFNLIGGQRYNIRMDYYEDWGGAEAVLEWQSPSTPRQVIGQSALSPSSYAVCIPGSVVGDFDNDCTVNNNDLQIMTDVWLGQQPTLTPPIIQLDTTGLSAGPLITWVNSGTLGGTFTANPLDANTWPVVGTVGSRGAVTFDNLDFMVWDQNTPASITGSSDFTVIYEVWNPGIANDEEVIAWAQRDGPDGTYATFNYGSSDDYGAVAHWGLAYDMGFGTGTLGVPATQEWHTIAVTYQGDSNGIEYVIVDGVIQNTEAKTLAIRADQWVVLGAGYFADPAWSNTWTRGCRPADWTRYNGSVSSIRVYDYYIPPRDLILLTGSPIDLNRDNIINFRDIAILANNWLVGPVLLGG